MAHLYR